MHEENKLKLERVLNFRPIDDVFFEVLATNLEVCQEILQTILEDPELIVKESIVQNSEGNIFGRSVRLDALCILGDGTNVNVEVQRSNNDDHLRRARFNASAITFNESNKGEKFEDILELYIVYISEFDFLRGGKTIYHIDKVCRETGRVIDDGLHEIFVNTAIDDGSDIAELMSCFIKKDFYNEKFPKLSEEVHRLKTTEGGAKAVSEVMDIYLREARDEATLIGLAQGLEEGRIKGLEEGMAQGLEEGRLQMIASLIRKGRISLKDGAEELNISVEELKKLMVDAGY